MKIQEKQVLWNENRYNEIYDTGIGMLKFISLPACKKDMA